MKKLLLLIPMILSICFMFAQASEYTFVQSTETYTEITGGTVVATGTTDDTQYAITPPFSFNFNFTPVTAMAMSSNGYLSFNAGTTTFGYTAISSTATGTGVVVPLSRDLQGGTLGEMRWEVFGTAPDRYAVYQWKNYRAYGSANLSDSWNFQVILYETSNDIAIRYGSFTWAGTFAGTVQVGLRGASNADFNNRETTTDWSATTAGTSNTATCQLDPAIYPATGLQFAYNYPVATGVPNAAILVAPANGAWSFTSATLSWISGGGLPDAYDVYLDTVDGSTLVSDNQAGTTYSVTVAAGTTYYWKVVASNSYGDGPASAVWSFKTPTATQLAESFEVSVPPPGWANGTTGNWTRSTGTPIYHGVAKAYKFTSTSVAYQLSTPRLTLVNGSTLDFWTYASSTTQVLQVVYSDDRVTWTQVGSDITYAATSTWYNQQIDLSSLAGNNYYLAFQTPIQTSTGSVYIDYVFGPEITPEAPGAPTLTAPADLAVNVSEYTTFSWTAPTTGGVPTGYNLYLDTVDGSTLYASGITSPYTVAAPLSYSTTYYWTVEAYNGAGGSQATVRSFTTRDDPTVTPPYLVDFGTLSTDWPVLNWTQLVNQYGTALVAGTRWYQDDFVNVTTPLNKSAKMNIWSANYGWLVTPPIAIPATGYELKFDIGLTAYASTSAVTPGGQPDDKFMVVISDNPMMTNPTILREWNNSGSAYVYDNVSNTGENHTLDLSSYVGTYYIAFYGESSVSNGDNDFFVDNVWVRETPANAIFSYTPTSIDFGLVMQNVTVGPQNVTITNTGGGTLDVVAGDISIIGTDAAMFSFDSSNLPAALTAGQSVDIPVSATVTAEGPVSATLRINNARPDYDVALSAEGLPAGILTIGNGTNVAPTLPIYAYFGYTYSQSIYLQSEINVPDQRIEKIWYYWNGAAESLVSNDWVIYMGHTDSTAFAALTDWVPLSQLTQVFSGEVLMPATAGWIEIILTNPFVYNNTQNLVVAVDENESGYDYPYGQFYCTDVTTNRSILYYSDGTNPDPAAPPTTGGYLRTAYPNVMLFFDDVPMEAPDPVTLTYPADLATDLPQVGFNLTWAPALTGGVPTYYGVFMSTDPNDVYGQEYWETTNTYFNPVTEGALTFAYDAVWYWTVQAFNTFGDAVVDPAYRFTIQSDPRITIPHSEDFGTTLTWPLNWTQSYTTGGSNRWSVAATANAGGVADEMISTWASGTFISRLITPPINTDGIPVFQTKFKHYYNDYGIGITAKLQYSHDLVTWYDTAWSYASGAGDASGTVSVVISGLTAPTTYVAWALDGNHYQYDYWYIDDVQLQIPPTHDVGVASWDYPNEVVPEGTIVTPMATVVNYGISTEDFTVTCEIGTYTNTQTVTGLAFGATQQVTFATYAPASLTADLVTVYTTLATDEDIDNDSIEAALICLPLDTPGLANNAQTDQFVQFNLAHPEILNPLPNGYTGSYFVAGADWVNGKWMGVEYDDGSLATDNYFDIDPLTGLYVDMGDLGAPIMGNAYDDNTDTMYGVGSNGYLYVMDPLTGAVGVGDSLWYELNPGEYYSITNIGGLMIDIAFDNITSTLYGIDLGNDCLWIIDPATYELTLVGFLGIDINYAQDAAFDQENGLLFLAGYAASGNLYWIDTTYGGAYKVGPLGLGYECTGFAIPYGTAPATPVVTASGARVLTWPAVLGAAQYKVYSSDDPYGTFVYETTVFGTSWTDPDTSPVKKFYQVTAVGGRTAINRIPVNYSSPLKAAGKLNSGSGRFETGLAR